MFTERHLFFGFLPEEVEEAAGAAVREVALAVLAEEDSVEVVPEEAGRKLVGRLLVVGC